MSGHTAGPWIVGPISPIGHDVWGIAISGHGIAIGCAYAGCVGSPCNLDIECANASLIAAAPELLAELEKAADTFRSLGHGLELLGIPVLAEACRIAEKSNRAVIAKVQS